VKAATATRQRQQRESAFKERYKIRSGVESIAGEYKGRHEAKKMRVRGERQGPLGCALDALVGVRLAEVARVGVEVLHHAGAVAAVHVWCRVAVGVVAAGAGLDEAVDTALELGTVASEGRQEQGQGESPQGDSRDG